MNCRRSQTQKDVNTPSSSKNLTFSKLDNEDEDDDENEFLFDNTESDDGCEIKNWELAEQETEEFDFCARPEIVSSNEYESLIFQQLDIDYYTSKELKFEPIFRLYGINKLGNSILTHVHGFYPYFYVECPKDFQQNNCDELKEILNTALKQKSSKYNEQDNLVIKIEYCLKSNIYGFTPHGKLPFLKISVLLPTLISNCKRIFEQGLYIPQCGTQNLRVYDTNIDFVIRFMVDTGLVGMSWVELPRNTYIIRLKKEKASLCQLEVDVDWDKIIFHCPNEIWSDIAPLRILSLGVKCINSKGLVPNPETDSVIQITTMIIRFGESEPFIKNIFTLNSCAPVVGLQIFSYDTEIDMLTSWSQFIRTVDPDIITGYDCQNIHIPYLINRSYQLKIPGFNFLGRLKSISSKITDCQMQSKQLGRRIMKVTHMPGRIVFDLLQILLRDYKLRSYSLSAVCFHFLEKEKVDLNHTIITELQNGDENTRRRLGEYSMKESHLVLILLKKLMCFVNYIEMARVAGVPFSYLLSRGQQIKVLSQLLRKAYSEDYILPFYQFKESDEFSGGTVIDPNKGFYTKPIVILDFASLYPSIMMAHNLCYTTLLKNSGLIDEFHLNSNDFVKTPCGAYFVKSSIRQGLLPAILLRLLNARKKAKQELALETDSFKKQILDGRQLAIKLLANSVYGFTGAQMGRLPCLSISSSVTAFGRDMIMTTKRLVEQSFNQNNGYSYNAKVIYGDTDSVMCDFNVETVAEAINLGKKAAEMITKNFIPPIKLEVEKIYYPYLLINKKRYAGLLYSKPDMYDKMECKGIETVRRDNCPLVADLLNKCLRKLLISRDKDAALEIARSVISDLLNNKIDISQLIISKELTKIDKEYNSKQPHYEVARKLKQRDPRGAPKVGDRVQYIIANTGIKNKIYTKAEDPIYSLENNLSIDTDYYLNNQLFNPLLRIFEPMFDKETATKKLLYGEHVRSRSKQNANSYDMARFTFVKPKCIGCKTLLSSDQESLCGYCKPKSSKIYQNEIKHSAFLERRFSQFWTQCQRCSGSLHSEVLCTNRDCSIFYMRRKAQIDLITHNKLLEKIERDLTY